MKLTLDQIRFVGHKRIEYDYSYSKDLSKYFSKQRFFVEYDIEIGKVPEGILAIPFLANVLPISWFVGFDIHLNELDKEFYEATIRLKTQFAEYYPEILNKKSDLVVDRLNDNLFRNTSEKNAMLFSGGVDAYTTYLRHFDENLDLITIRGADIKLDDDKQWKDVVQYTESTAILKANKKFYITSNIRDFITFEVDKILPNLGWWGKIQHGLALICLTAPVAWLKNYKTLYIASTRSIHIPFSPWGSMPETDNLVNWGITQVIHDGYELSRLMKVESIVTKSNAFINKPPLRVCYNEFKNDLNCNICEKCCRTIFALIINAKNPNDYGFNTTEKVYDTISSHIRKGFKTHGTKLYWEEMLQRNNFESFFVFSNRENESNELNKIIETFHQVKNQPIGTVSDNQKRKQEIISRFPSLFNLYLKIRRKLI